MRVNVLEVVVVFGSLQAVRFTKGRGCTVTVALPDWACEQVVVLASCTLSRLYIKVPTVDVGAANVTEFPAMVDITWLAPPLILYVKV